MRPGWERPFPRSEKCWPANHAKGREWGFFIRVIRVIRGQQKWSQSPVLLRAGCAYETRLGAGPTAQWCGNRESHPDELIGSQSCWLLNITAASRS